MNEFLTSGGYSAAPYLLVVVLCVFKLLANSFQRRAADKGADGPHASWRVSELETPFRRFWQVTRDKGRRKD